VVDVLDSYMLKELLFENRSPLLKCFLTKQSILLKKIAHPVFREILKYA
jgi:hypothetical protein